MGDNRAGGKTDDALASPLVADMEGDSFDDRIYVGNLYGDMYRVVDIGKGQRPELSTLFTFDNTVSGKNPIRSKADYSLAYEDDHIWVYWGTGLYEDQTDKTDMNSQYFFGIQDWDEDAFSPKKPHKTYRLSDLKVHTAKFVDAVVNVDGTNGNKTFRWIDGHNPKVSPEPRAIELFAN